MLSDIKSKQYLSRYVSSGKGNKSKYKQMGLYQTKKFTHTQRKLSVKRKEWKKIFANDISS